MLISVAMLSLLVCYYGLVFLCLCVIASVVHLFLCTSYQRFLLCVSWWSDLVDFFYPLIVEFYRLVIITSLCPLTWLLLIIDCFHMLIIIC